MPGLALLRHLADKTGLAGGLSRALASARILVHDRGRGAGGPGVRDRRWCPGDLRFPGDVRSGGAVRAGGVGADGVADAEGDRELGKRADSRITAAVNAARRHAWAQICARHGALPGVRLADKTLDGVTCIRLDATVTFAHSDKELGRSQFQGIRASPAAGGCGDNTGGEPLAWELRRGSAAATPPRTTSPWWTRRSRRCRPASGAG